MSEKPSLVSVDFNKKIKEQEDQNKVYLLSFLDKIRAEVEAGNATHMLIVYENPEGDISSGIAGQSDNYFRFHWVLREVTLPQYEDMLLIEQEEYD